MSNETEKKELNRPEGAAAGVEADAGAAKAADSDKRKSEAPAQAKRPPPVGNRAAEVIVQRGLNDLRATVQVIPPTGNGQHVNIEKLRKALADKKVIHGIDEEALARIVAERSYAQVLTVAHGDVPQDGLDAQLVYHYDKLIERQDSSLDNLGQVNYKELGNIISADPETLLLEKIPPTEGEPGQTVTGKPIRQIKGKDLKIRCGKGVRVDPSGLKWFSEIAGQVIYRNDQISIENVLEVENVDSETGNVHFKGTVIVKGIVEDGFVIDTTADIRIMGSVGAAKLTARGDIAVVGGVFGKGQAVITTTEGSIYVRFSQDARLRAARHIVIEEYSRNSTLRAGHTIHVVNQNPNRGRILGGSASAIDEIHANNIGGEMEIATRIMVGISKEDVDRINELETAIQKRFENLEKLNKSVFIIQREKAAKGVQLDERRQEIYTRLLDLLTALRENARYGILELVELYRSVYAHRKSYLHVNNQIFPNVDINIQLATMVVRKPITFASLSNNENEVNVMPFRDHDNVNSETDEG
ncbi:MAG: FapA family protein [Candidatus Lernaella stagnicola]|nr:FapA family protein [Candidatus Lernaella stagnicola]